MVAVMFFFKDIYIYLAYFQLPLDWVVVEREVGVEFFKFCFSLFFTTLYPSNLHKVKEMRE